MAATSALRSRPGIVSLADYSVLKQKVKAALLEGYRQAERARVRAYWQAGKDIDEHLFFHKDRAKYGDEVIPKLASDLKLSASLLYQCLEAYRGAKNLYARVKSADLISWTQLRTAIRIKDEKKRELFLEQAAQKGWTSRDVEVKVQKRRASKRGAKYGKEKHAERLPMVCLGPFYTYKIIKPETISSRSKELLLDLGFSHTHEMSLYPGVNFPAETILTSSRGVSGKFSFRKVEGAPEGILYTFQASIVEILDGDTLKVEFQLGLGNRLRETIRLAWINCPELTTAAGVRAKRFVESELADARDVTIKSTKTKKEKWGRYLGDLFYRKADSAAPVYLNQLLLDKGHAVRMRK